ncbi:hypothetical protein NQZ68_001316 [Dissostichus eleginoides]|nr:hypothetical protein NQZ68_001316 [Dissostichus eleginoides]
MPSGINPFSATVWPTPRSQLGSEMSQSSNGPFNMSTMKSSDVNDSQTCQETSELSRALSKKIFNFKGFLKRNAFVLLTLAAIVIGMSSMDKKAFGKLGLQALRSYTVTTLISVFIGIVLVVLIKPGKSHGNASAPSGGEVEAVQTVDAFLDLIRYCGGLFQEDDKAPMPGTSEGVNILGLLVFCIAFGLILGSMENEAKPLRDVFDCLNKATMHLISIVI